MSFSEQNVIITLLLLPFKLRIKPTYVIDKDMTESPNGSQERGCTLQIGKYKVGTSHLMNKTGSLYRNVTAVKQYTVILLLAEIRSSYWLLYCTFKCVDVNPVSVFIA